MTSKERIKRALEYADSYGGIDGDHHKMWVIDQIVRALTGSPMVKEPRTNYYGQPYTLVTQGESEEYKKWIATHNQGEDGPNTYAWEHGIAP